MTYMAKHPYSNIHIGSVSDCVAKNSIMPLHQWIFWFYGSVNLKPVVNLDISYVWSGFMLYQTLTLNIYF